jgi:hypothetical protein
MSNKYKMFKDQCGGGFNKGDKVKVSGQIKLRKPSESSQTLQMVNDKNGEITYGPMEFGGVNYYAITFDDKSVGDVAEKLITVMVSPSLVVSAPAPSSGSARVGVTSSPSLAPPIAPASSPSISLAPPIAPAPSTSPGPSLAPPIAPSTASVPATATVTTPLVRRGIETGVGYSIKSVLNRRGFPTGLSGGGDEAPSEPQPQPYMGADAFTFLNNSYNLKGGNYDLKSLLKRRNATNEPEVTNPEVPIATNLQGGGRYSKIKNLRDLPRKNY